MTASALFQHLQDEAGPFEVYDRLDGERIAAHRGRLPDAYLDFL